MVCVEWTRLRPVFIGFIYTCILQYPTGAPWSEWSVWARLLQSLHGTPSMFWSEYTLIEWA